MKLFWERRFSFAKEKVSNALVSMVQLLISIGDQSGSKTIAPFTTTDLRIKFSEVHLKAKTRLEVAAEENGDNIEEVPFAAHQTATLGGVARDNHFSFFPGTKGKQTQKTVLYQTGKRKRRWHKRPDGYKTDDEAYDTQNQATVETESTNVNGMQREADDVEFQNNEGRLEPEVDLHSDSGDEDSAEEESGEDSEEE